MDTNRVMRFLFLCAFAAFAAMPLLAAAHGTADGHPPDVFYRAKALSVHEEERDQSVTEEQRESGIFLAQLQVIEAEIISGDEKGKRVTVTHDITFIADDAEKVSEGDTIVIGRANEFAEPEYYFVDLYRLPWLALSVGIFFALAIFFGRLRGLTSLIGLAFSIAVLVWFVVPRIMQGHDPFLVSLAGAAAIALVSLYLAHGFRARTTVALSGTVITLAIAAGLAVLFVRFASLFGLGSEEAFFLQFADIATINLRGLLLGGIIIGSLGVLDDITVGQAAVVEELKRANPALSARELYARALSVGREHIASLINTLVLAYVGVSLPLLLLFTINQTQPVWLTINSEVIAEEVVRTLVGSAALIFAVPITTFIAARFFGRKGVFDKETA